MVSCFNVVSNLFYTFSTNYDFCVCSKIGESMNNILNENWQILLDELKPAFEEAIGAIAQDIVNKAMQKTAFTDIFPQ